jgi:hypothetical protein
MPKNLFNLKYTYFALKKEKEKGVYIRNNWVCK